MSEPKWENVYFDIEANGLLEDNPKKNSKAVTKCHSIVLRDMDSGEPGKWDTFAKLSCADQPGFVPISVALEVLRKARRIYGHNIIGYDLPALHKLFGNFELALLIGNIRDTSVIAQMRWTNRKELDADLVHKGKLPPKMIGKHTLKAWGYRLGELKGAFADDEGDDELGKWEKWTPEMQLYCEQDTNVGLALAFHVRKAGVSPESVETEQELAWFLREQERNGWPFDLEEAHKLYAQLAGRREEIRQELKRRFGWKYKPNGHPKSPKKDMKRKQPGGWVAHFVKGAPYVNLKKVEFNPGSRPQIAERLKEYGWIPTAFTEGGQPKIDEEVLEGVDTSIPEAALLVEFLMVNKRISALAEGKGSWLNYATKDKEHGGKVTGMHHIHGAMKPSGTQTHRGAHFAPNMGQVPKADEKTPYGAECRALFRVPKGWIQVGIDVSGLELRLLGHYMGLYDKGAYANTVVNGDVHTLNRDALGLSGKEGRENAKTWIYAFLYGAGELKLGRICPPTAAEIAEYKAETGVWRNAKKRILKMHEKDPSVPTDDRTIAALIKGGILKRNFLKGFPALKTLLEAVKAKAKEKKFLLLPDGRRVPVRSEHSALNFLLQGAGAVICKRWVVMFARRLRERFGDPSWNGKWSSLGWVHDELQLACRPEIADEVERIGIEEIEKLTAHFKLRVQLSGKAQRGNNWRDCH